MRNERQLLLRLIGIVLVTVMPVLSTGCNRDKSTPPTIVPIVTHTPGHGDELERVATRTPTPTPSQTPTRNPTQTPTPAETPTPYPTSTSNPLPPDCQELIDEGWIDDSRRGGTCYNSSYFRQCGLPQSPHCMFNESEWNENNVQVEIPFGEGADPFQCTDGTSVDFGTRNEAWNACIGAGNAAQDGDVPGTLEDPQGACVWSQMSQMLEAVGIPHSEDNAFGCKDGDAGEGVQNITLSVAKPTQGK